MAMLNNQKVYTYVYMMLPQMYATFIGQIQWRVISKGQLTGAPVGPSLVYL
jgi:hypothetical protein